MHNIGIAYTTLTDDELPIQVTANLVDFKITYEFDGEVYDTEQYDSIEDMIENGLTGLDFSELVSVPDEVIERHTADRTTIYIEADVEDIAELAGRFSFSSVFSVLIASTFARNFTFVPPSLSESSVIVKLSLLS